jgi:hypothetical protein
LCTGWMLEQEFIAPYFFDKLIYSQFA